MAVVRELGSFVAIGSSGSQENLELQNVRRLCMAGTVKSAVIS
jgi:hypothetical protein